MFPCSRNAHDEAVLVGRTQLEIIPPQLEVWVREERIEWPVCHQKI